MKYLFYSLLYVFFIASVAYSQDDFSKDPQVIFNHPNTVINAQQDFLLNPTYVNMDLSNNSLPQNEPSVRISRTNPNIVVAAWRDFRLGYLNPVVRRIGYCYSTNGGSTWSTSALLPDPAPEHSTQSDPVLIDDANGNFYLTSTSRDPTNTRGETVVYKSTNNGVNWVYYSVAASSSSFEDKEWITCDLVPGSPYLNSLYITWTRIPGGIRFIKSTNGGLNWSSPVNVGDNSSGQGSNIAVGTNSYIYVVWGQSNGIKFDKSTNGGTSFGTDYALSTNPNSIGFPFICVDYSNHNTRGNVYVIWDDNRNGSFDVWLQRSTNAGTNWLSSPIRVNDVTTNNQYKPIIQCDTNGYLSVVYYDERTGAGVVNSYYAYSIDAGNTWVNTRLSDSSFAYISIGSEVRNGEYIGIDAYMNKIIPVWCDDRRGTPDQEIFASNISILTGIKPVSNIIPKTFTLSQNYPNPFNPVTNIDYTVPNNSFVNLKVYDVLGNETAVLVNKIMKAGNYSVTFDASALSTGIYFYTLRSEGFIQTKKMMLLK